MKFRISPAVARTAAACCALWLGSLPPAQAALLDLFTSAPGAQVDPSPDARRWDLPNRGHVMLTGAEDKSLANEQPVRLQPELLKSRLAGVRLAGPKDNEALFEPAELDALLPALVRALALARPGDDLVLASIAAHGGSWRSPTGITARLFVREGSLNLIVNDTAMWMPNGAIPASAEPTYAYGSRTKPSRAALVAKDANAVRPDWLRFDLAPLLDMADDGQKPAAAAAVAQPKPEAAPLAAPAMPAAPPPPKPAALAAPAAAVNPVATAPATARTERAPRLSADEIEERLTTLKRLRGKGLISEEEYVSKRAAVLDGL